LSDNISPGNKKTRTFTASRSIDRLWMWVLLFIIDTVYVNVGIILVVKGAGHWIISG
jgi:hypothetical protein